MTVSAKDVTVNRWQGGWHCFSTVFQITQEEAAELQMQLGYHPAGYGLYGFKVTEDGTEWKCATSCD